MTVANPLATLHSKFNRTSINHIGARNSFAIVLMLPLLDDLLFLVIGSQRIGIVLFPSALIGAKRLPIVRRPEGLAAPNTLLLQERRLTALIFLLGFFVCVPLCRATFF